MGKDARMAIFIGTPSVSEADSLSALVHRSFTASASQDWEPIACTTFYAETSPAALRTNISVAAYVAAAYDGKNPVGFVLMPNPSTVGMLFVDPARQRNGIGRSLWESSRAYLRANYPEIIKVTLNSTPCAYSFYRALGFVAVGDEFVIRGCRATRMICSLDMR